MARPDTSHYAHSVTGPCMLLLQKPVAHMRAAGPVTGEGWCWQLPQSPWASMLMWAAPVGLAAPAALTQHGRDCLPWSSSTLQARSQRKPPTGMVRLIPTSMEACRTCTLAYAGHIAAARKPGKAHTALMAWPSAMPSCACASSAAVAAVWLLYGTSTSCTHVQDILRSACMREGVYRV